MLAWSPMRSTVRKSGSNAATIRSACSSLACTALARGTGENWDAHQSGLFSGRGCCSSSQEFDSARPPRFVEPRFERKIEAKDREPSLTRRYLDLLLNLAGPR